MKLGRFARVCSRSALACSLIWFSIFACAQQSSPPAAQSNMPTLPAAEPISQAARRSAQNNSQATSPPAMTAINTVATAESFPTLHLGAGDLLEISVYNVPELTTKARVSNSGDIYLPLIDYVHVADLTLEEAQTVIEKRLVDGGYVRNAHVTIFLDESASQGVTILGEVMRPGIYPALGDRRLYDMISAAGGFAPSAGRKISIVRQHDSSSPITVNLPRDLAEDAKDNIEIRPGDTITIPRAPIVYVVGEVGRPAGLLIDNGSLTVLQALALAGGTTHTAKMGGTCIIRKGPNGMTETRLPLKKMLEAKAPDVQLQADDILFVPLSGAKVAGGEALSSAIAATAGLAILVAHP
jgi:polysaccharide biosynthesis/export protein